MMRRMRSMFVVLALCAGCDEEPDPSGPMAPGEPDPVCTQDNAAFVREATLAVLGRRPLSQQEAESAAALIDEINKIDKSPGAAVGRRVWLKGVMGSPEFIERWQEILLDALQVPRTDVQALSECYGTKRRKTDDAEVATFVRDHDAKATGMEEAFNFLDVMRSSLVLDDLSPIYRAHLFAMLTKPNFCGNVDPVQQELTTRQEVGHVFDAAYTNRDQVCLSCHNSEESVTFRPIPAENRHFAIAAKLEKAVFGASEGVTEAVPHAVFRTSGMLSGGFGEALDCGDGTFAYCNDEGDQVICGNGAMVKCPSGATPTCNQEFFMVECAGSNSAINPWGAEAGCGTFNADVADDPADVDARLATVKGKRATVFDLEQALKRGVDVLAKEGLVVTEKGDVKDPEAALAYLVALNIVDRVWKEVIGSSLTISTRFPRTQAAHDRLEHLTNHFVAERFSLKTLLLDIVQTAEFNALAPADGCGPAYALDPVFDPWVRDEPELERRRNSAADGVHPLSPRTLMSATYAALGWPVPQGSRFPGFFGGDDDMDGMDDMDGEDFGDEDFGDEDFGDDMGDVADENSDGDGDEPVPGDGDGDGEEPVDPVPPVDAGDDAGDAPDAGMDPPVDDDDEDDGPCGDTCDEVYESCNTNEACCNQIEPVCGVCWNVTTCEGAQQLCNDTGNCCSDVEWWCNECNTLTTCEEAKTKCDQDMACCDYVEWLCDPCLNVFDCASATTLCDEQMECCDYVPLYCEGGGGGGADELGFQRSIGVFLSISQKGFRGLDLSARLAWEERFGSCKKPEGMGADAIDRILDRGIADKATLGDTVLAIKDRLIGEARFDEGEGKLLEDLLGAKLKDPLQRKHLEGLRQLCGALLSSPEHLLGGLAPRGGEASPLAPSSDEACQALRALSFEPYTLRCEGGNPLVTYDRGH
jgi:hypothetical protein